MGSGQQLELNNNELNQECVEWRFPDNLWFDENCFTEKRILCQKDLNIFLVQEENDNFDKKINLFLLIVSMSFCIILIPLTLDFVYELKIMKKKKTLLKNLELKLMDNLRESF